MSVWEEESFYTPQDLLIVGAGLMGLWTALAVKQQLPGLKVSIIERTSTPLGASTRNAGFACFGSPTELIHDAERIGTDAMLEIVEMRIRGIEKIKQHFSVSDIVYDDCGGYECINKDYKYFEQLPDRLNWLNRLLKPITGKATSFTEQKEQLAALGLRGFDTLVYNPAEAGLHSGHLVRALIRKVQSAGVTILSGINIEGYTKNKDHILLLNNEQIALQAKQVLFCTNAFTQQILPSVHVTAGRGQIIVTSPIPNLLLKGTFHFDEGFYYWRNLGNRILLGGARNAAFEEEETTEFTRNEKLKTVLVQFLKDHISPDCDFGIDYHWSGIMGFTDDKKPCINKVDDGVFAAIACNGMGVALTPIMAEKAASLITEHF
jgi:glycine/D-amino acid oxidase-like deaminating enzyme